MKIYLMDLKAPRPGLSNRATALIDVVSDKVQTIGGEDGHCKLMITYHCLEQEMQ
ncbi:MAG: hypothetical protein H6661_07210 [Ardenticatenaceae bacterium]|nr:hypothetical protein [Ardenticatenaceae bacterium]